MTDQLDLFAARQARDDALTLVASRDTAMAAAYRAARAVAGQGGPFTAEDVRACLAAHDPDGDTAVAREPRVLGAALRLLAQHGYAKPTDRHVVTGRVSNHARPQRVWRAT